MKIWTNSKYIEENDTFLCDDKTIKYLFDAVSNGASKIIYTKDKNKYLYEAYYNKIKDLILIGITGTNGKTTTSYLIYQMLNKIGVKTSYIGTIGFYINNDIYNLDNTTPSMDLLYNLLLISANKKCKVVVMEVSSHALKQDRVYGLLFDAICVTNITEDHLDYHKTLDDYILSKKKLINMTRGKKICMLNKYDKYYKKFISKKNNNIIIGKNIKIKKVKNKLDSTTIYVKDKKQKKYNIKLIGMFNVYNFLCAYFIIKSLGYDMNLVDNILEKIKEPSGRMQKIDYKENVIFIDYAHTPDAVKNVLKTVRKIKNKKIITIIGCGGNREKEKRPIMANIACKYSDEVIFTNDNPRYEDEKEIIEDMIKKAFGRYKIIYDRYDAIKEGIEMLDKKMILMILGKGHEDYQIIGDKKLNFSDAKTVEEIISN